MSHSTLIRFALALNVVAGVALPAERASTRSNAQPVNDPPNPYKTVENWAKMPAGRTRGATSAVEIDGDGKSIWVADGHGGNTNARIVKFSKDGKFIKTWGKKGQLFRTVHASVYSIIFVCSAFSSAPSLSFILCHTRRFAWFQ